MKPGLPRSLLAEVVRYLAATQTGPAVVLHGAWMLLALAVWQHADGGSSPGHFSRVLLRAFVWLGGTDGDGVGSEATLLVVWGKISLVLYLLDAAARALFGPREPIRLRMLALISGLVALAGYGFAFLAAEGDSSAVELMLLALLFAALAAGAVAWAVGARRVAEAVISRLEADTPAPRDPSPAS